MTNQGCLEISIEQDLEIKRLGKEMAKILSLTNGNIRIIISDREVEDWSVLVKSK